VYGGFEDETKSNGEGKNPGEGASTGEKGGAQKVQREHRVRNPGGHVGRSQQKKGGKNQKPGKIRGSLKQKRPYQERGGGE